MATLATSVSMTTSAAESAQYYHPSSTWCGVDYYDSVQWTKGALWWKDYYEEDYYEYRRWYRPEAYYTNSWIINQGQTVSITQNKTKTCSISSTVTSEISASYEGIGAKVGGSMTVTDVATFSSSLSISYDLSNYTNKRVRIASMINICEFYTETYCNGYYQGCKQKFAYDTDYGRDVVLVYR